MSNCPGRTVLWPLKSIDEPSLWKIFLFLSSLPPEPIDSRLWTAPLLSAPSCQYETAPNSSTRSKPTDPLPGPTGCGACAAAPQKHTRAPRRPGKTTRSRSAKRSQFGKRLDARTASGRPSIPPVPPVRTPGTRRGPIKATRSGTATQRDILGSRRSHLHSFAQRIRPWLPQFGRSAPRHARSSSVMDRSWFPAFPCPHQEPFWFRGSALASRWQ